MNKNKENKIDFTNFAFGGTFILYCTQQST